MDLQLRPDVLDVRVDRALRDLESDGDLFVGQPGGDQGRDLALSGRQSS